MMLMPTIPPTLKTRNAATKMLARGGRIAGLILIAGWGLLTAGCGSGGYAGGGGIQSFSRSEIRIDAGQSIPLTAAVSGTSTLSWTLTGPTCTGAACGTLAMSEGGTSLIYSAPAGLTAQMSATLTASVPGGHNTQSIAVTVNPDPTISTVPPAALIGSPYSATLTPSGGTGTLTISAVGGSVPDGLTFNATTGIISGTPTKVGTFNFALSVLDQSDVPNQVVVAEIIVVSTTPLPLTVISGNPPIGTVGKAYTTTLAAAGGTTPYAWSILSGSLPAGLALAPATGIISGTPTVQGTSIFTAQVQDATGTKANATFSITINNALTALTLTTATLPNGTVGVPYSATIGVTGGAAPYTCQFTAGTLPAGLIQLGCVVSGIPTAAGTSSLTVKATDSSSPALTVSGPESITIAAAAIPLTLTTSTLPSGTIGVPYSATIGVAGGAAPYLCAFTGGTLPAGLSLSGCVVSGIPTVAGTATLTLKATDSSSPLLTISGPESITINPISALALTVATLPNGTVGVPYSATIGVTGGTGPYLCLFTAGTLPAGLILNGCVVSGTPTTAGTSNLTVKVTDSSNPAVTITGPIGITIVAAPVLVISSPPPATVGTPYTGPIPITGGTGPYTCVLTGTLPTGLSLNGCSIVGTPTTPGTTPVTVKVTDSGNPTTTTPGTVTLVVNPSGLTLTNTTLPGGTVGVPYSATIGVTGGTSPYTCIFTSGTLPAGLSVTGCTVSGTPTAAGTSNLTVKATDSGTPAQTVSGPESITIAPATLTLTNSPLPSGTVGVPYSATIGVTGGTSPYTCVFTAGTLPAGLSVTGCTISGTPTAAGTSNLTVKTTDSGTPAQTATGPESITIAPATLTVITPGTLPNGTVGVPYSTVIAVSGGTSPYTCVFTVGTLPAGLSVTGCTVSGTPTAAGTANLTVKATDSGTPAQTATGPESITIAPATLVLTNSPLPGGTVGIPYSATIGVSGGTSPYTCVFTSGTLPAGLNVTGCTVSGTPTTAGTSNLTVKTTDSGAPVQTATGPESITIAPATLTVAPGTLPNGTVGAPYSAVIAVSGGTSPYTCVFTAGTLPAGLSVTGCTVSGTPTTAVTANLTVKATDSGTPAQTATGPETITIAPAALTLTNTSLPNGTVGVPYSAVIAVSGGTSPYTCVFTAGTLPAGLSVTGCTVSGTPTAAVTANLTVKATDSGTPAQTVSGPESITIAPAPGVLNITGPGPATIGVPYTGPIVITGGTGPYHCVITAGALQAGLSLSGCSIVGTPTVTGSVGITVQVTDSGSPAIVTSAPITITVNPVTTLTLTGTTPNAVVNVPYSATLTAAGGITPYAFSLSAGALPAGLTLSGTTGVISGTPTTVGASSFTVTVTDAETTKQTASLPLTILVTYATTPTDAEFKGPYAFLFQGYDDVVLGVFAYKTATVGSFTADGTGVISAGELDANHQSSLAAGATVSSNGFLGTYTLGTDSRGLMTITTLNANGTTAETTTYAISLKAPVTPATTSTQGSLVEYDGDQLSGTKGSGSILQQTTAAFSAGLKGNYVFGVQGDTPCLPTCTINLAGPVASVGVFAANGSGTITNGTSDSNIGAATFVSEPLSGSYAAADGNGRVQMALATAGTAAGYFPTDYAVYMVNANQAFVMSTDKHSQYILLAGSTQLQTQTTYSNASMNGPFLGYENSATNPGLVGATLTNVLNVSTATIFRATGTGDGNCNVTNVDEGGLTGLVSTLTGLGGSLTSLNNLLGTFTSTGPTTCSVATSGRGVMQYPIQTVLGIQIGTPPAPRIFYLASPEFGYFLETSYAGLGNIEPQTGAPFTLATFKGTYVYASTPASSLASINSSGYILADGAGKAFTTVDENIGVGTINVLQLGVTNSGTYVYASPDTSTGRYVLNGTTVIYAISPNRFVLVDTNPLTTSPSVTLLY